MTGIIIGIIIVLILIFTIITYNNLIRAKNNVKNSLAQIDTQLQRRFDLIPNLVETVKGIAAHEKELLENVTASRSGYMNAHTAEEKFAYSNQLTAGLKTLFAVAENYPEIKSNENFSKLQGELSETEDKVTYSRQFYNDAVTMYNNKLQTFPNNVIGSIFGFREEVLFKANEDATQAPKVEF